MDILLSQTGVLSLITLSAIFGGMGWFAYKMYMLSAKPATPLEEQSEDTK